MSTTSPLLIDLAGAARLAGVRRPVVSMWRSRFATAVDPFPSQITEDAGRALFDASQVAEWLVRTGHGSNSDARADAASEAVPPGFAFTDEDAVAELEAVIALYAQVGTLEALSDAELRQAAKAADPQDLMFRSEVEAHAERGAPWLDYAELLIDAAYSPSAALALVHRRASSVRGTAASTGPLVAEAVSLVVESALALVGGDAVSLILDGSDAKLSVALADALGDTATLTLPRAEVARRVRRRLLTDGHWVTGADDSPPTPRSVVVARVPSQRSADSVPTLLAVDEVSLGLRDDDAAVVIGPARILTDPLGPAETRVRADILRSGRVRGIARLATGLVETASREALALWMLGAPHGDVAIADRVTVVADLTGMPLTPATRADLVSDVIASMGGLRDVRAHAFRFSRPARTPSLAARGGSLVASAGIRPKASPARSDIPALIDTAADAVRSDITPIPLSTTAHATPVAASVEDLIQDGHLKVVRGVRLDSNMLGTDGLIVVTASDLDAPETIGDSRVDQLAFATQHPRASLTRPGDVVFRTSPRAAAWVDADGSKVVVSPARVLRITAGDPGGLVPEVVAADIAVAPAGPGAWKRWMLRRVAPHTTAPLRKALAGIAAARADLEQRAARLNDYADLIVAGATSGAVTMIEENDAADAAATQ
ncbi:MAG TPA: hypothetical protein VN041_12560 [Microbacterium sp.]|nr:hypothetical protein [Microbacterium sp.]